MQHGHPHADQPPIPAGTPADAGMDDHARFVWSLAGQMAAGMLANPGKQHYSVKDSISLFDEVLHEITSYVRVRGDFGEWANTHSAMNQQRRGGMPAGEAPTSEPQPMIRQPAPAMAPVPPFMHGVPMPPGHGAPMNNASPNGPMVAPGELRQDVSMELPELPLPPADSSAG